MTNNLNQDAEEVFLMTPQCIIDARIVAKKHGAKLHRDDFSGKMNPNWFDIPRDKADQLLSALKAIPVRACRVDTYDFTPAIIQIMKP